MAFSPYTIHLAKLPANAWWFHISRIQETANRLHFIGDESLDYLKHVKYTDQFVNMICLSQNGIYGLRMYKGIQYAYIQFWLQRCSWKSNRKHRNLNFHYYRHISKTQSELDTNFPAKAIALKAWLIWNDILSNSAPLTVLIVLYLYDKNHCVVKCR